MITPVLSASSIIVYANWFQFAPGEHIVQRCRQSRMLLWCRQGLGTLTIGPNSFQLGPDRWLLLPWGTAMMYQADTRTPFLVAGVHWIPHHDPATPVIFRVAHGRDDTLSDLPARRDAPIGNWRDQILQGDATQAPGLIHLGEYIVNRFNEACSESVMRILAGLLLDEVRQSIRQLRTMSVSAHLEQARRFALLHLAEPLDTDRLCGAVHCSRATLARLFRRGMHTSPASWLADMRIAQARRLLRSTALSVQQISRRVGIDDPYYFSRVFRRKTGVSPRQYRAAHKPL